MDTIPLPRPPKPLTTKQQAIYDFIVECCLDGQSPTIREIAVRFKIKSPNGVMCHLLALKAKNMITMDKLKSRGIRPTKAEYQVRHLSGGRVRIATTGPVTLNIADLLRRPTGPLQQAA